jgi:hypothetical protein
MWLYSRTNTTYVVLRGVWDKTKRTRVFVPACAASDASRVHLCCPLDVKVVLLSERDLSHAASPVVPENPMDNGRTTNGQRQA